MRGFPWVLCRMIERPNLDGSSRLFFAQNGDRLASRWLESDLLRIGNKTEREMQGLPENEPDPPPPTRDSVSVSTSPET